MSQFGNVCNVEMKSENSAFVDFENHGQAERAVRGLSNKLTIGGKEIYVGNLITPHGLNIPLGSSFSASKKVYFKTIFELRRQIWKL